MAKYGFLIKEFPVVLGCDMSGVVSATGPGVTDLKVGDAVYGFTELGTKFTGTFATHAIATAGLVGKKPSNLSFEQASTLGGRSKFC